jgi:hypothetical protein
MRPVWMVRSRQIAIKLAFWLALIGYNPRDHSLSHRIYLVYASIFMSLWGFAMLSLVAGATATGITLIGIGSANQTAVQLSLLIIIIWFLYQLWRASRRSPFVFSEEDAYLICLTPVRRSFVALSWFVGDWFLQALPFWALGVTLGFAMVEAQLGGSVPFTELFRYLASGLRALSIFVPLQMGLLALVWALGALRLQGNREWHWLSGLVLTGIILAVVGLAWGAVDPDFGKLVAPLQLVILWPVRHPLQAAFSIQPWENGLVLSMVVASLGVIALAIAGDGLNLGRAAQESTQREKLQTAQRYGMADAAREIKQRDRLGIGRAPTRLPAHPGPWVLLWKDILQSRYELGLAEIWNWLILLAISFSLLLAPDFGSRVLLSAFWIFALGQRVTSRLRADLANWWMLRSLPLRPETLLWAELAAPWSLAVVNGWLAILLGGAGLGTSRLILALLVPPVCLVISLVAIYDILRQSKSVMLLNGNPPGISALTILGGVVCLALPMGITWLLSQSQWIGVFLAFAVCFLLAYGLWHMAVRKYRLIS